MVALRGRFSIFSLSRAEPTSLLRVAEMQEHLEDVLFPTRQMFHEMLMAICLLQRHPCCTSCQKLAHLALVLPVAIELVNLQPDLLNRFGTILTKSKHATGETAGSGTSGAPAYQNANDTH